MSNDTSSPAAPRRAEPESFRARSLSASLTVNDMEKSLAFYTEVVGFAVDERFEREGKLMAAALMAGDVRILINQDDGAKGWDRGKGAGSSLMFTTVQDVDAIARRIKERGGTLETEPMDMHWGSRVFTLRDPDGFKLVISTGR